MEGSCSPTQPSSSELPAASSRTAVQTRVLPEICQLLENSKACALRIEPLQGPSTQSQMYFCFVHKYADLDAHVTVVYEGYTVA